MTDVPRPAGSAGSPRRHLNGISELRTFFRTNSEPIYFVGPTSPGDNMPLYLAIFNGGTATDKLLSISSPRRSCAPGLSGNCW